MSSPRKLVLHFVQDTPTPHNNVLLKALQARRDVDLRLWYAMLEHPQYAFSGELAYEPGAHVEVYGWRWPSWKLISTALLRRREKFFVIGWMNPTTRLLIVLFWLMRRPYNMWFDRPNDHPGSGAKMLLRNIYYALLRRSRATVYVVGTATREYFRARGFAEERLVNLPILVDIDKSVDEYRAQRDAIRARYNAAPGDLFIVTGSRLVREKGFDLLLDALALLDPDVQRCVRVLIVGKGEEKDSLKAKAAALRLERSVFFEDWMDNTGFMSHLAAADLAVHPARYDAYGGITLAAMVAGIPVAGSDQAGSARDRIEHGVNGWLYQADDCRELARWISVAAADREALRAIGARARSTAERYSPAAGAMTLIQGLL